MILPREKTKEMLEAAKPLIKWMNENCHPHCTSIVTATDIELVEGIAVEKTFEFVRG
jgi:hypothetical protein